MATNFSLDPELEPLISLLESGGAPLASASSGENDPMDLFSVFNQTQVSDLVLEAEETFTAPSTEPRIEDDMALLAWELGIL